MGKILVIEGTDCSGKTTQYEKLCERFKNEGISFDSRSFPDYESEGCFFVKEYLAGEFGIHPSDTYGYTSAIFFSLDRYYSFMKKKWGESYRNGANIILSRYITSNILHHSCKLDSEQERIDFINWLYEFENNKLRIPKEDGVILLDMPIEFVKELKKKRGATSSGGKDIHEEDEEYLKKAHDTAVWAANRLGWTIVKCVDKNGNLRTIDDIHEEIYGIAKKIFE